MTLTQLLQDIETGMTTEAHAKFVRDMADTMLVFMCSCDMPFSGDGEEHSAECSYKEAMDEANQAYLGLAFPF